MDQLRIVSWNLQGAFGVAGRLAEQAALLRALGGDALLLQESPSLRAELPDYWWHRERTSHGWGTSVALLRERFTSWEPLPNPKPHRPGRLVDVRASFGGRSLRLLSVHPQAVTSTTARSSSASGWVVDLDAHLADEAAVIGGDWNTGRPTPSSFFPRAAEAGWYECAQTPPEIATYLPRKSDESRPWVLDHVFCRKLPVTHVTRVDASPAVNALSDHRPLVVDLTMWPGVGASVDAPPLEDEAVQ